MSSRLTGLAVALFVTTACVAGAQAQSSYPCANDLPNPYRLVTNWATTPRGWAPINAITVDDKNNFWGVDRCEEAGCKSVFEISPDGKTIRNFGTDLFVEQHQVAVDHDGNVWVADASPERRQGPAGDEAELGWTRALEARQGRSGTGQRGVG